MNIITLLAALITLTTPAALSETQQGAILQLTPTRDTIIIISCFSDAREGFTFIKKQRRGDKTLTIYVTDCKTA